MTKWNKYSIIQATLLPEATNLKQPITGFLRRTNILGASTWMVDPEERRAEIFSTPDDAYRAGYEWSRGNPGKVWSLVTVDPEEEEL